MNAKLSSPFFWIKSYDRWVLQHPLRTVATVLLAVGMLSLGIRDFRMDASADSLVLENDRDLLSYRTVNLRYESGPFLIIAMVPKGDLLSDETLETIRGLAQDIRRIERVESVTSILDAPLFKSPPIPLEELQNTLVTLGSGKANREMARRELRESPLYRNLLVSPDLETTALQIHFQRDAELEKLLARRTELRKRKVEKGLDRAGKRELERVSRRYSDILQHVNARWTEDIETIRNIMVRYREHADLHLGGVPMIANDMISFVKKDLKVFGTGMTLFLILALGAIFRRKRWVFLPMMCCALSVAAMMGLLGIFHWKVTVISSNFISLQLIFTIALNIHLIVRFNEILAKYPQSSDRMLTRQTVRTIFVPCLYTALTTIAGFCSLLLCGIKPVEDFGWMMTMGIAVSFVMTFLFFPAGHLLMHRVLRRPPGYALKSITLSLARFTQRHGGLILGSGLFLALFTAVGIGRLRVENSFINYFKPSTEIYRGMKHIDDHLGGTTPLDVVIDFEPSKPAEPAPPPETENVFDEFAEFEEAEEDDDKYWFTMQKMAVIEKVHEFLAGLEATGKVLSLYTLLKIVRDLHPGERLDNFNLALLFRELPERFQKIILDPYVSLEHDQARVSLRVKDSLPSLRRRAFLNRVARGLKRLDLPQNVNVRVTGMMVLYNNMLRSLFRSQIQTIGFTVLVLMAMFWILFRSFRICLIAIFPNLLASLSVLGVMGFLNIPLDMMTITIVAISIGIAVDNTIHYLHRFKREFSRDGNYMNTLFRCHGSIGNALYYTSIVIIVGFSILAFSNFIPSILFGILTGLAMAVAMLSALTLLPRLILRFRPFGPESPPISLSENNEEPAR